MAHQIYLVIVGTKEPYVAERNLEDMTRERTIADLAAGEWGSLNGDRFSVSSIIEVGTDKDVTDEFVAAAIHLMDSFTDHCADLRRSMDREAFWDHVRDERKHSQAAE